jgi:dTDP-4-amino-4,6-dideoxygalactose transaminase
LEWLDSFTQTRRKIADAYQGRIFNPLVKLLAKPEENGSHVYHLFVVTCIERDRLSRYLTEAGIGNLSHYPVPVHRQPPCSAIKTDPNGLACAEQHAGICLSIPCHPQMTHSQVEKVIEVINAFK